MSRRIQNTNRANSNIRKTSLNAKNTGIVIDVILDDTNKRIEEYDFSEVETKNTGIITNLKLYSLFLISNSVKLIFLQMLYNT